MALRTRRLRDLLHHERGRERVRPTSRGWTSVEPPWDLADREQTVLRTREHGKPEWAARPSLRAGTEPAAFSRTGAEKIAAYLFDLTDFLCEMVPTERYRT